MEAVDNNVKPHYFWSEKMRRFGAMLLMLASAGAKIYDFEADAGAVPCKKTFFSSCDTKTAQAVKNTAAMNRALAGLAPGDTLLVPNKTFSMMGGVYGANLTSATLRLDGTLLWSKDTKAWPTEVKHNKTTKMPIIAMTFERTTGLVITSTGTGTLDGNGAAWWGLPGIGYLVRGKNRPPLLTINDARDFLLENIDFIQAPRFNFQSSLLRNATIRNCHVDSRRTSADSHGAIDLTAFNTDGFDVSGTDIHIHDCSVWNQDDTFCIKSDQDWPTSNVLIENVQASGVGLSIGSIGAHAVANITFRNVVMHHTSKGIYVKFNAKAAGGGSIKNVTYENIHIEKPSSWPIWIGPQQAGIKEDGKKYNPCDGDPCSLCWPQLKTAACPGVAAAIDGLTLRNITISKPATSPGVIIGNASMPMRNVVFDGVRFEDPPANGAFGSKYFHCEGVEGGIAKGGTWPVPPCFTNETVAAAGGH